MRPIYQKDQMLKKHPALRGVFQRCYTFNIVAVLFLLLLTGCAKTQPPVTGTAFLMDTIVDYQLYGPEKAGQAVEDALAGFEARFSVYRADSEIAQLNAAAGKEFVALSDDVYELLRRCADYGAESGGAFDVTVAPVVALWDITGENPRIPTKEELEALLPLVNYRDILFQDGNLAMLAKEGQKVDLGGIAKGYACELVRKVALENGVKSGYLSIGGNIMVIGQKPGREDFRFGIRDPRGSANDYLAAVTLPDSTMATSGDYERYFERDGVRYHHILDPATGAPARSDLISVSVVSPDGAYADYMSTYLFIKGKAFALENLNAFSCGLVVIDAQYNVFVSDNLKKNFVFADQTNRYHYEGAQ